MVTHTLLYIVGMNKQTFFAGYIVASLLLTFSAYGEVYQWVDEKGQVHFGNVPPGQQGPYKLGGYDQNSPNSTPGTKVPSKPDPGFSTPQVPVQQTPMQTIPTSVVESPEKTVDTTTSGVRPVAGSATPVLHSRPKAVVSPQELEDLIKRLRTGAKIPKDNSANAPAKSAVHTPEVQKPKAQKPVIQKPNVHKQEILKTQKPIDGVAKTTTQGKTKEKAGVVVAVEGKAADISSANLKDEKDAEKCGVFTGFVITYEAKVKDDCPGAHCAVYERSLKSYKIKKERYCQP